MCLLSSSVPQDLLNGMRIASDSGSYLPSSSSLMKNFASVIVADSDEILFFHGWSLRWPGELS